MNNLFPMKIKWGWVGVLMTGRNSLVVHTPYTHDEDGNSRPNAIVLKNIPHKININFKMENGKWVPDWSFGANRVERIDTKFGHGEPTTDKCRKDIFEEIEKTLNEFVTEAHRNEGDLWLQVSHAKSAQYNYIKAKHDMQEALKNRKEATEKIRELQKGVRCGKKEEVPANS